jgi:glutamate-5-semialdehyde dehydrogenase
VSHPQAALLRDAAEQAAAAARVLALLDGARRNALLESIAAAIERAADSILDANAQDVQAAAGSGLNSALLDRLRLDPERLAGIVRAVREVAALPDPLGVIEWQAPRADGLQIGRVGVPLGVIAMIYESRPNVTVDAAVLCLKSGNAALLRGGSDARRSNEALAAAIAGALDAHGLPRACAALVPVPDRAAIAELLRHDDCIALAIPRGGEGLIRHVAEVSRVPVIRHYKGVCHLYVDRSADLGLAMRLLIDGKCARPSACNALETLLVDAAVAAEFLPEVGTTLGARGVALRADSRALAWLPTATPASAADWDAEYLDLILAVAVVDGIDGALAHIARHGSLHTEVIATDDAAAAERFLREVDASAVMVNASSRFNDGGELGLGAEIGVSTTKLHAYGPMGLTSLTTRKWIVCGSGHVRSNLA